MNNVILTDRQVDLLLSSVALYKRSLGLFPDMNKELSEIQKILKGKETENAYNG